MSFKNISFLELSSGSPFVRRSENIRAILVESIMRNNSVKLFRIKTIEVQEEMSLRDNFYQELWQPSVYLPERNHYAIL